MRDLSGGVSEDSRNLIVQQTFAFFSKEAEESVTEEDFVQVRIVAHHGSSRDC